ncbi:DUF485 domain-containing protein [Helicobacter sp. MIT 14-3879]|uniref:DUF485 domain-containing protein n=1 Tax=Helicobacter sp. MIT 14-3879 TaxID=2040649 RepID=UPI000E1EA620|nr:DUF485 domain-containing protein [Helicobacter sp. MIT 14-3879]RDU65679.1 DUF485 domain-containing protein [Helicobacter sp. MIT 14-3879]
MTKKEQQIMDKFKGFVSSRNKLSIFLSLIVLVCYYAFIIAVGYFPKVLGYKIGPSVVTLGIVVGVSIIVISIIVTGIYTFIANKYLDKEQENIIKELQETGIIEKFKQKEIK